MKPFPAVLTIPLGLLGMAVAPTTVSAQSVSVQTWGGAVGDFPAAVPGLPSGVTNIQSTDWGGLATNSQGEVWSWFAGINTMATRVRGPSAVTSMAGSGGRVFAAAATSSGALWAWGGDNKGQLCNGKTSSANFAPEAIPKVTKVGDVAAGFEFLLLLRTNGHVSGCGSEMAGELGNGKPSGKITTPVDVTGLSNIVAISAASYFAMALDSTGNVWDWGQNTDGQLGDGTTTNSDVPVEVLLPAPAVQIYAGDSSSVALLDNGEIWGWGADGSGQLGNGATEPYSDVPIEATSVPSGMTYVATEGASSYTLDSSGNLWAWGDDSQGQLGDGNDTGTLLNPEMVNSGVLQVSAVGYKVVDRT